VRELVGVQDRPDGDDDAVGDLESGDPHHLPVLAVEDDAGIPVHHNATVCEAVLLARLAAPADQRLGDAIGADERDRDGRSLAAAVAVHRHVGRQELDQRVRVALFPGREEAARDLLPFLTRDVEAPPSLLDVSVRANEDLAAVVGALADDLGHLVVGVVEDLAEEEDGPLDGRQLLEQVEEGERERVGGLRVAHGLVLDERLRQPLPGVDLAARPRRPELVDREPGGDRREVGLRRLGLDPGLVVAEVRLLDDVLGLGDRPEHPVGDRKEVRSKLLTLHHSERRAERASCDTVTATRSASSPFERGKE
jgi:hypothetical protein